MKIILIAFLMMVSMGFAAAEKVKIFEVSKVKSDKTKLKTLFKRIQQLEKHKKYRPWSFEVLQTLKDKEFLVYTSYKENGRLARGNKLYCLIRLESKKIADGDVMNGIWVNKHTKQVKTYTTVLGAQKSVSLLTEVIPIELSKKEFLTRLKAGETWTFHLSKTTKCKTCHGKKQIRPKKRSVGSNSYVRCPKCHGKGSVTTSQKWLVKW